MVAIVLWVGAVYLLVGLIIMIRILAESQLKARDVDLVGDFFPIVLCTAVLMILWPAWLYVTLQDFLDQRDVVEANRY